MVTARWVFFDADAETSYTAQPTTGISGTGTFGYVQGTYVAAPVITISAGISDQMTIAVDNGNAAQQITLTPGANLDIRMVCREIEFKAKQLVGAQYDHFSCRYVNNKVRIYSGKLGTDSLVSVGLGGQNCLHLLGMADSPGGPVNTASVVGAASTNNGAYTGAVTVGGTYVGQFSEIYQVLIATGHPIGSAVVSGTYAGAVTTNGFWNHTSNETYTVTIDTTNGAVLNAGSGNVPRFTVTSTLGDNIATQTDLLYSDYYYEIGTKGLRAKFSDSPFGSGDTISITCSAVQYAQGLNAAAAVGSAQYVVSALRENKVTAPVTSQTTGTAIGNSGLTIAFSNSGSLTARDKFTIIASQVQPSVLGGTTLNFGSVTVSTYSPTAAVWFELISGATKLSNTKFGLNSNGSAQHHFAGNSDTKFAFGNVGEGTPSSNGSQWKTGVDGSTDLASDTPPAYLAATEDNLSEVNTASASEVIGVAKGEMVTDYIYTAIKLGASETGANSTIVYRMFFDFS